MARTKKPVEVEPYWQDLVSVWFNFCRDKFGDNPSFEGSAPRDLKAILKSIHERATIRGVEWTKEVATQRLNRFLLFAYNSSQWLRDHWLLSNLNRQKDTVFFNIQKSINQTPVDPFQ